jgi:hypothetical protein
MLLAAGSPGAEQAELPSLRLAAKPTDVAASGRLAHSQPAVPADAKEVPFVEKAPELQLTEAEQKRGYLLFHRPLTEPIYPNTHPLADERLEALTTFAAPGQFQPVTFALYPVRALRNLRVRASALNSPDGEIPADRIDVRLATYWNIGYPSYTTLKTYRRRPELLERVTAYSSPAGECQRYCLTIHVPDDVKPGLYRGTVLVWDDDFDQAVEIPLAVRVLSFRLQKDPRKHYSAYFSALNPILYKGQDEAFIRRAADNDYRAMAEYGLDMLPTFNLGCRDGKNFSVSDEKELELERMLAAGLSGPVPVIGDGAITAIYRQTTPGGQRDSHWRVDPQPPPVFYERITEGIKGFEVQRKAKGWPEFIYCPIDEVNRASKDFGSKVYAAVKAAGVRTYATKDPQGADAAAYAPYLDIWCSQPYSVPYEQIVSQDRHEYWCYPNHNAGEIKDPRVMCKGGRMTYGFGLWRSGYTTLIPWDWCWTPGPDAFDYLRGSYSGCGQRVDDEGEVIPAVYWACFRQGCDDGRYIYTLQQAIAQREGSKDPACVAAMREGKQLLQKTWDDIRVQPRYLAEGMWPSEEFDAIRWRLAMQIERLLAYPVANKATAPSVMADAAATRPAASQPSPFEAAEKSGAIEKFDLGIAQWSNSTAEGNAQALEKAHPAGKTGLRWTVTVDHEHDGGEGGKYPIGWPRISRMFKAGELDLTRFDALEFWIRVDSSRQGPAALRTPIGLFVSSHETGKSLYETTIDLGPEHAWVPLRFSIKDMMAASDAKAEAWKSISRIQLYIAEENFADKTRLVFDVGEASLVHLNSPVIAALDAPRYVLLPCRTLVCNFELMGMNDAVKGRYFISAMLEGAGGAPAAQVRQDLTEGNRLALPLAALAPGDYTLRLAIQDAAGKTCSQQTQDIAALAGPLLLQK